jgi:hypothetical protein
VESARARILTTRAVGAVMLLAGLCLGVGSLLAARGQAVGGLGVSALRQLGEGTPAPWLSLGVLLLILTPSTRMLGMLLTFRAERRPKALAAGAIVLAFLLGALITQGGSL